MSTSILYPGRRKKRNFWKINGGNKRCTKRIYSEKGTKIDVMEIPNYTNLS